MPFLVLRFLQGVGSGVCWGLGRIIAADVMQDERLAAIGSYFTLFLSLSPLLAPVLGGYIQHWFGWQANFILLGSIILFVLILLTLLLEETNQHKRPEAFALFSLLKTYSSFFQNRLFIGCTLLTGIAMSANILYTTMSSFIFQQQFNVTPIIYGWLTAVVGAGGIMGKLTLPFFILNLRNQRSLFFGILLLLLSGIFLSVFTFSGYISVPVILVGVCIAIFAQVIIGSITMAMALSPFHDKRGSAGALFGSFQLLISFAVSAIVTSFPYLGTHTLAIVYLILGLFGFVFYFALAKSA